MSVPVMSTTVVMMGLAARAGSLPSQCTKRGSMAPMMVAVKACNAMDILTVNAIWLSSKSPERKHTLTSARVKKHPAKKRAILTSLAMICRKSLRKTCRRVIALIRSIATWLAILPPRSLIVVMYKARKGRRFIQ